MHRNWCSSVGFVSLDTSLQLHVRHGVHYQMNGRALAWCRGHSPATRAQVVLANTQHAHAQAGNFGVWSQRLLLRVSTHTLTIFVDSQREEWEYAGDRGLEGPLNWDCELPDPGLVSDSQRGHDPTPENRQSRELSHWVPIRLGMFPTTSPTQVQEDWLKGLRSHLPAKGHLAGAWWLFPRAAAHRAPACSCCVSTTVGRTQGCCPLFTVWLPHGCWSWWYSH